SGGTPPSEPSRDELARWIKGLPAAEKDAALLRFLTEEGDTLLRTDLFQRYIAARTPKKASKAGARRRTVAQLFAACDARSEEEKRKKAERAEAERARRDRERAKYLDELAVRETETWREVDELIATKQTEKYDRAVTLITDLYELAERSGSKGAAEAR